MATAGRVVTAASLLATSAVAAGLGLLLRRCMSQCDQIQHLKEALEHEKSKRAADRTGRIKAERQLRELRAQQRAAGPAEAPAGVHGISKGGPTALRAQPARPVEQQPLVVRPIGVLRSCFNTRNGTPRQPLLVSEARAELQLARGIPPACLDGLDQYSHCWVLYVFHCNTDSHHQSLADRDGGDPKIKAKIRVPRLDGGRMGVLATRTPHRPNPLGLSVAEVVSVSGGRLILGGADIVDGSPVLDIKPYVPFCDSCQAATAPGWVRAEAEEEPLHIEEVVISGAVIQELERTWRKHEKRSLYPSARTFETLVLSRDIRSAFQRGVKRGEAKPGPELEQEPPMYTVVLDGVAISYRVQGARVEVTGAEPWQNHPEQEHTEPREDH